MLSVVWGNDFKQNGNTKYKMGLITIQLFRSEDSARSVLEQLGQKSEICSDT